MDSVFPCNKYLTFGPWIYLVPQYRPKNVLILGHAGGTVAGLILLLYGQIPITAVDILPCDHQYYVDFTQADAQEFVKTSPKFDAVIVDLFQEAQPCKFITEKGFVENLARISNYIIVNTLKDPDMSEYGRFDQVAIIKPPKLANKIFYFKNGNIPNLMPFEN